MKLASSWIKVLDDKKKLVVVVGVYIPGKQRVIAVVHVSTRRTKWLTTLKYLSDGLWVYKLTLQTEKKIKELLAEVNENAGTEFELASVFIHKESGPKVGLVGG